MIRPLPIPTLFPYTTLFRSEASYQGDFIGHWAHELIFFQLPPWAFTTGYLTFGFLVLLVFLAIPPRRRRAERQPALVERSEEHTSELQSPCNLVCCLLLVKK